MPRTINIRLEWLLVAAISAALIAGFHAYSTIHSPQMPAGADLVQLARSAGRPTVVEFGASNCNSCRQMKVVLGELARREGAHVTVIDIDLTRTPEYIGRYRIQLMPTQIFFDAEGREIGRHMGVLTVDEILERLGMPIVANAS